MGTKLRLTPKLFRDMQNCLGQDAAVEQGCFLLCSEAKAVDEHILIANEFIRLSPSDLLVQEFDQLSVAPGVMLRIARMAQQKNTGICFVHTHPMSRGEVSFSRADDIGNAQTFGFFNRMLPKATNSALVFSGDMMIVAGRVYHDPCKYEQIRAVTIAGYTRSLTTMDCHNLSEVY